jgi:hypothetical protein
MPITFVAFEHGQMTHTLVGHQRHALLNRLFWPDMNNVSLMMSLTNVVGDVLPLRMTFRE